MELFKKIIFLELIVVCFSNCGSNHQRKIDFTQEAAKVYYETLAEDNQRQAVRIDLYLEFKEPITEDIHLKKIYFRNQEAVIEKVSDRKYVAHFSQMTVWEDVILDRDGKKEYGNKAPIIVKPKFKLSKDEAVLEYNKNEETIFFKLIGINEK
jgi:hypothetical protein